MPNTPTRFRPEISKSDHDGARDGRQDRAIHNTILKDLWRQECDAMFAKSQYVDLPTGTILNEMDEPIEFAYFINSGLASILNVAPDGKTVEVGLTGKEGFVGLPLIVGFSSSPTQAIIQIKGSAFRISAKNFKSVLQDCPALERTLQRYSQELALQVSQVAACNRLHELEERLARWLLMSQDRVGDSTFELTQEFLSHMLGTRRASVTVAAGILQKAGLITYKRGVVRIENREQLENAACDCYKLLNSQIERWHQEIR